MVRTLREGGETEDGGREEEDGEGGEEGGEGFCGDEVLGMRYCIWSESGRAARYWCIMLLSCGIVELCWL